jgi:hypothetical protein
MRDLLSILKEMLTQAWHNLVILGLRLEVAKSRKVLVKLELICSRRESHWRRLASHPFIKTTLNL